MKNKTIITALIELLKVRSLMTLTLIGVLSYLAIRQIIDPAVFTALVSSVVTYYFVRKEGTSK